TSHTLSLSRHGHRTHLPLPSFPTRRSSDLGNRDLTAAGPRELTRYRRETIGFVFQFYNLVPNLTARENVMVSTEISRDPLDVDRSEEHTSELQSLAYLVCRLLLEKKNRSHD